MSWWSRLSLTKKERYRGCIGHKLDILDRIEKKSMSNTEAALELQLTLQAITYILKPDHVEQLRSYRGPLHRRRLRSGAHLQLERELNLWIAHVN